MDDVNDIRTDFTQTTPSFEGHEGLEPPFSRPDFMWSTTTKTPEPMTYDSEPMFLVENGAEKYLYDDIMTALSAMIEYDSPIEVYQWDRSNNRFSHYIDLAQTEE